MEKEKAEGQMKSEYDFESLTSIRKATGKHAGEWISIVDNKIIATGANAKEVFDETKKKYPKKIPYVMKIPSDGVMLL